MKNTMDLTKGNITKELIKLALPIFGTSFIQIAYGIIDTYWIGKLSDEAVAAVGTSGYFLWIATSLAVICKIGGNVNISQSIGAKDSEKAKQYISHTIILNGVISIIYTLLLLVFSQQLIGFFKLGNEVIEGMAVEYLIIVGLSMVFFIFNPVVSSILTAFGNTKTPFIINSIGLVFNIVLDPILILGYLGFPKLGVAGAAIATALSQVLVSLIFIIYMVYHSRVKNDLPLLKGLSFKCVDLKTYKSILQIGLPASLQSVLMAVLSMVIAKIIALWGAYAIAAQKVGSQIESISWATCEGFSVAVSTFIGQNYGAKKFDRLKKGYFLSIAMVTVIGFIATIILLFYNKNILSSFVSQPETIAIGINYLVILSFSQIFMCIEITTAGAFSGVSKPSISAAIIIIFTAIRIPLAHSLSATSLGLDGVWWGITISSILKGTLLFMLFLIYLNKLKPRWTVEQTSCS